MWKIFSFLKLIVGSSKRMKLEKEYQANHRYSVDIVREGPNSFLKYRTDQNTAYAEYDIDRWWSGDCRLFVNSYLEWNEPKGVRLTKQEHELVTKRFVRYLAVAVGMVELDFEDYLSQDELKELLEEQGTPFSEVDGFLVYEVDSDTLRENLKKKEKRETRNPRI